MSKMGEGLGLLSENLPCAVANWVARYVWVNVFQDAEAVVKIVSVTNMSGSTLWVFLHSVHD